EPASLGPPAAARCRYWIRMLRQYKCGNSVWPAPGTSRSCIGQIAHDLGCLAQGGAVFERQFVQLAGQPMVAARTLVCQSRFPECGNLDLHLPAVVGVGCL